MRVPKSRQRPNKFEVITKTRKLASYTTHITSNETQFSRQHQWLLDKLNNLVIDIYLNCFHANNMNLKNDIEAEERRKLQYDALRKCDDLLALIELSKSVFHLRARRVEFWSENTLECMSLLKNWMESDRKRK